MTGVSPKPVFSDPPTQLVAILKDLKDLNWRGKLYLIYRSIPMHHPLYPPLSLFPSNHSFFIFSSSLLLYCLFFFSLTVTFSSFLYISYHRQSFEGRRVATRSSSPPPYKDTLFNAELKEVNCLVNLSFPFVSTSRLSYK